MLMRLACELASDMQLFLKMGITIVRIEMFGIVAYYAHT